MHRVGFGDLADTAGDRREMHELEPLALHSPGWKGGDAGSQLERFPVAVYYVLVPMFRTEQYSEVD